jgi:hypothetical protein
MPCPYNIDPMQIITVTSHVADQVAALEASGARQRWLLRPVAWALLIATPLLAAYLGLTGRGQLAVATIAVGLVALLLIGVALVAGPNQRDVAIKRAGAAGESILPQALRSLPDSWTLLNGVPVPGARADIDHVLVGPGGIWAIEAKHHVGMVQCVGDAWGYARTGPGGVPQPGHIGNPSGQARRAAEALERYLGRRGVTHRVQPLVVFTHPKVELQLESPTVPVIRAGDALALVSRPVSRFGGREAEQIVALLRQLRPLHDS